MLSKHIEFDALQFGIIILNTQARIVYLNTSAQVLLRTPLQSHASDVPLTQWFELDDTLTKFCNTSNMAVRIYVKAWCAWYAKVMALNWKCRNPSMLPCLHLYQADNQRTHLHISSLPCSIVLQNLSNVMSNSNHWVSGTSMHGFADVQLLPSILQVHNTMLKYLGWWYQIGAWMCLDNMLTRFIYYCCMNAGQFTSECFYVWLVVDVLFQSHTLSFRYFVIFFITTFILHLLRFHQTRWTVFNSFCTMHIRHPWYTRSFGTMCQQ